jgi:hypothetical protein
MVTSGFLNESFALIVKYLGYNKTLGSPVCVISVAQLLYHTTFTTEIHQYLPKQFIVLRTVSGLTYRHNLLQQILQ